MKLYRYDSKRYSIVIDADREIYGTSFPKLELNEYDVSCETPKGFWISYFSGGSKDKWISKSARKRFAYPTKNEALDAYIKRKTSYVRHSERKLAEAKEDLKIGENEKCKPST